MIRIVAEGGTRVDFNANPTTGAKMRAIRIRPGVTLLPGDGFFMTFCGYFPTYWESGTTNLFNRLTSAANGVFGGVTTTSYPWGTAKAVGTVSDGGAWRSNWNASVGWRGVTRGWHLFPYWVNPSWSDETREVPDFQVFSDASTTTYLGDCSWHWWHVRGLELSSYGTTTPFTAPLIPAGGPDDPSMDNPFGATGWGTTTMTSGLATPSPTGIGYTITNGPAAAGPGANHFDDVIGLIGAGAMRITAGDTPTLLGNPGYPPGIDPLTGGTATYLGSDTDPVPTRIWHAWNTVYAEGGGQPAPDTDLSDLDFDPAALDVQLGNYSGAATGFLTSPRGTAYGGGLAGPLLLPAGGGGRGLGFLIR